jgi:O-antigen/teichoic acid export membrane protein
VPVLGSLRARGTAVRLVESFASSSAIMLVNAFTGIVLARQLGAHARGELAAVLLWPSIVAVVGSLGLSDATTYYAARKELQPPILVGSIAALWVAQSVLLCAIGVAVVPLVLGHDGTATVHASLIYVASIPPYLATAYLTSVLQGWQRLSTFQAIRFLVVGLTAVGLGIAALGDWLTVQSAVVVYLSVYAGCALVSGICVAKHVGLRLGFSGAVTMRLLAYAVRSHADSLSSLLNQRLDQLLISIFLAPLQLGLYVVAVTLSSLTSLVGSSVALVAMPAISRLEAGTDRTLAAARFIRVALICTTVATIPMLAFTPELIRLFFGESFESAAGVARVLLVAAIVYSASRVASTTLKAIGRPLDAGLAELVALGATIAGLAALLPFFGLMGAAVASVLAYAVSAAWMVRRAAKALDLGWTTLVIGASVRLPGTARA